MSAMKCFRADQRIFRVHDDVDPSGDHLDELQPNVKAVELLIRKAMPNGHAIRGESLHVFVSQEVALRYWFFKAGRHLYELEVEESDILHKGDMNLREKRRV